MKHILSLTNDNPSQYFEIETDFKTVIISNVKFSNQNDCPLLLLNWLHGPFGEIFSIPISHAYSKQKNQFDAIEIAKHLIEPFLGPFNRLDVKIESDFLNKSSKITFEIELK